MSLPASPPRRPLAGFLFTLYRRALSPAIHALAPSGCKHLPTCSEYAYLAVLRHGWVRGSWLALRRVARCHPWREAAFDPVP